MAELIDKGALVEKLKRTSVFECVRNSADKNVFEIIGDMPTTTEAEIRAKAIDEFLEKAEKQLIDFDTENGFISFGVCLDIISKVAEQLKGE